MDIDVPPPSPTRQPPAGKRMCSSKSSRLKWTILWLNSKRLFGIYNMLPDVKLARKELDTPLRSEEMLSGSDHPRTGPKHHGYRSETDTN